MFYSVLSGYYHLLKTIGNGGFGKVKQAIHLLTGEYVAIKIIDKTKLGNDVFRIDLEIKAMKDLHHQHICKLYQVIETNENIFLVLEYFPNGELFDYIVNRNRLSEDQARHFFRQIVSAVAYMHNKGYCHRDLKPENLLLDRQENLKLIDFGLCAEPKEGIQFASLGTACGSPSYAAPELIAGHNYRGDRADIWSLGVLLYALLCGMLPFDDDNIALMYAKIQNGFYHFPSWLSRDSISLLSRMLQVDPSKRIRIDEIISHPWLINNEYMKPVEWRSIYKDILDLNCLREMTTYYGLSVDEIAKELSLKNYDYMMATYCILFDSKSRTKAERIDLLSTRYSLPPTNLLMFSQLSNKDQEQSTMNTPKKLDHQLTASKSCNDATHDDFMDDFKIAPSLKSFSLGAVEIDDFDVFLSPQRQKKNVRSLFGSMERSFNTFKQILTPKRSTSQKPRKVSETANVTSFYFDDCDQFCNFLQQAIRMNSQLKYRQKRNRFVYNVFIEDDWGKVVLEFDLDIVIVQGKHLGIQRQRTKGNVWHYKRCCEDIIKQLTKILSDLKAES